MASGKRASMREGPLAALFRKTEEEGLEDRPAQRGDERARSEGSGPERSDAGETGAERPRRREPDPAPPRMQELPPRHPRPEPR
ncbi:MAG: hypothetical protein QOG41_1268, partial [Thermoleophilaceae bacterium]|nr:hypothetical protein [Thermoleophilaceae bacterium]